jgi:hypothetical protein
MPEETSTGKYIFPIRSSKLMKKEGWFTRPTNTKGVSVRLATLKSNDETVVQAYIFDSKKGWTMASAKKWLKGKDISWLASLDEENDDFKGKCLGIEIIKMVISGDDAPQLNIHHTPGEKKKKMVRSPKKKDKGNGGGGHKTCSVRTPR